MHESIGQIGHLAIIISFVTSLISTISFVLAELKKDDSEKKSWQTFGTWLFHLHSVAVISFIVALFVIIYNHYYEYHYAWSHSSNFLPTHFMISCFWEGQEGSFMLWIFWNVIVGQIILWKKDKWTNPVMAILISLQVFLTSMILGIVFFNIYKMGSSPFILLRDVMDAPIFSSNPNYVPEDGTGLNPLLQNYWMVIHPPTLFLGFALTQIPFAYCIAGLWRKDYAGWIKPVMSWSLIAALVLGTGIIMGGYWAYETLNFGGYWNWDPVENAVYVPWLVLIAAFHMMLIYKKNKTALKSTIGFVLASFLLILYSTFLTRSGVLGSSSVHSFTDLGLSGQLLIYLLFFLIASIVLAAVRWKDIPGGKSEGGGFTAEFWLFVGVIILSLAAFQVTFATSIPVINKIIGFFGEDGTWAPPADQITYYGKIQIWASIVVSFVAGIGQYIWWRGADKAQDPRTIKKFYFLLGGLFLFSIITVVSLNDAYGITNEQFAKYSVTGNNSILIDFIIKLLSFILLLTSSLFLLVTSIGTLIKVWKTKLSFTGVAITHIGLALLLIGILFSSAYDKIISENKTGMLISKDLPDDINLENILLYRNGPKQMNKYKLKYLSSRTEVIGFSEYVDDQLLHTLEDPHFALVKKDLLIEGDTVAKRGDSVEVVAENTYYEVEYESNSGEKFSLFPRSQVNPSMGFLASPDLQHNAEYDLYTHVSTVFNPDKKEWRDTTFHNIKTGDTLFINDYVTILDSVRGSNFVDGVSLAESKAIAVTAYFRVLSKERTFTITPSIVIVEQSQMARSPDHSDDVGIQLSFLSVDPNTETFTFSANTAQLDFIVLKVVKKPLINLLWIGTLLIIFGMTIAARKRYLEAKE